MNRSRWLLALVFTAVALAGESGDYVQQFDTLYNNLTVERRGTIVELRARSRRGVYSESVVDLSEPRHLLKPLYRTLFAAQFFQPSPQRVLMIGLGGAAFHRLFTFAYPHALLQSVELDPKVFELSQTHLGFVPTDRTPVAIMDGRLFIRRNKQTWDWIILDAFRGGFVSPHLKTEEFYRECAARLNERGVLVSNLFGDTELYYADIKTLRAVFPQVLLFHSAGSDNVVAFAMKYKTPSMSDPAAWAPVELALAGWIDMAAIRREKEDPPEENVREADLLTDDFAPVEFLNIIRVNNTTEPSKDSAGKKP